MKDMYVLEDQLAGTLSLAISKGSNLNLLYTERQYIISKSSYIEELLAGRFT